MSSSENIVKLNIGGYVFKTSKSTLTKFDGFFKTLLETEIPVTKDETGAIFIDRDPKHFRLILNFMREGSVELPNPDKDRRELLKEAQYYQLNGLVELCDAIPKLPVMNDENQEEVLAALPEFIKFNIRGTIFETRKSTLKNFLACFKESIETISPLQIDGSCVIFVDREPKHFHLILDFMRNGDVTLPISHNEVEEILKEARAYQLKKLIEMCETSLNNIHTMTVRLDIGGTVFKTLKKTLTKHDGALKSIVENQPSFRKDPTGAFFIDRNPKYFDKILDYMRNGDCIQLPTAEQELKEVLVEARAYQLEGLIKLCENNLKSLVSGSIIKLNIGGTLFQTKKSILTKYEGFFKTMMETENPVNKDDSGAIFIDRSPKHFDLILNFMRDGDVELPNSNGDRRELLKEAQFYQLEGLEKFCRYMKTGP